MTTIKLTKAQTRVMGWLKDAPARGEATFWWEPKREDDGRVYLSKTTSGVAVISTLEALARKGVLTFEEHPEYSFAWIVTIL